MKEYSKIEELPKWAVSLVQKLIDEGIISYSDSFEFNLTDDILRILLILARVSIL
jgi:hypothetical protein